MRLLAAQGVHGAIVGDAGQPGFQPGGIAQGGNLLPCFKKRLLGNVIPQPRAPGDAPGHGAHGILMPPHDFHKSLPPCLIPSRRRAGENRVRHAVKFRPPEIPAIPAIPAVRIIRTVRAAPEPGFRREAGAGGGGIGGGCGLHGTGNTSIAAARILL